MTYKWKQNTAVFLTSQAVSILGSSLVQFAITSYITVQTKSGAYATIAILCAIIPTFLLSPFAGVWADRYNRKVLIMLADGGIAFCTLIMAILFLTGHGSIPMLCVALIIRGLGSAIQQPCIGALLPDIVPEEHLTRINGISGTIQALSSLASPIAGAMLLTMIPLGSIFFVDIITAVLAILIMLIWFRFPQKKSVPDTDTPANYFGELKAGFVYIRHTKFLMHFFIYCVFFFILMAPAMFLTQIQVVRNYGDNYWYLSAIDVAFSIGMVFGGVLISLWGGLKNKIHTLALATTLMGACTFVLGIRVSFTIYLILMGIFGLALPLVNTPVMTLLQEKVDSQYTGRVFGVMTMINTSMMPLGMIIFGPMADVIDVEILLLATGLIIMILSFLLIKSKELCRAGA